MSRLVSLSDLAMHDIATYHAHLAAESADAADRFLANARHTFIDIASTPHIGRAWASTRSSNARIRVWRVDGFPKVLVFYRLSRRTIEVIRVLHGSRDLPEHL